MLGGGEALSFSAWGKSPKFPTEQADKKRKEKNLFLRKGGGARPVPLQRRNNRVITYIPFLPPAPGSANKMMVVMIIMIRLLKKTSIDVRKHENNLEKETKN